MNRLPFEPRKIKSATPHQPHSQKNNPHPSHPTNQQDQPITITALANVIKNVLGEHLPKSFKIIGQVSNLSDSTHWFFSLKDENATIRAVCFASTAKRIPFKIKDGMQVIVTAKLDYYDAQGAIQLYVQNIQPLGQGDLQLAFEQLCQELRTLGYFQTARKKALPLIPKKIAILTSRKAAALQDVIDTAKKRWAPAQLYLCHVPVQGETAAAQIAKTIDALSQHANQLGIDVILLTRGGGSIEDLWAFNQRILAEAIFKCPIPIVAAIGHETDTTIAELVADQRCATPTQAAMRIIPDANALHQQLNALSNRLKMVMTRQTSQQKQKLQSLQQHPVFKRPQRLVQIQQQRIAHLAQRLNTSLPHLANHAKQKIHALTKHLQTINPSNVLKRGYSYTTDTQGKVITHTQQVKDGDTLITVLAQGQIQSIVGPPNTAKQTPQQTPEQAPEHPSKQPPISPIKQGFSFNPAKDKKREKNSKKRKKTTKIAKNRENQTPGLFD